MIIDFYLKYTEHESFNSYEEAERWLDDCEYYYDMDIAAYYIDEQLSMICGARYTVYYMEREEYNEKYGTDWEEEEEE